MKPYKYAIFLWRREGNYGLTLPMLSSLQVWMRGKDYNNILLCKAEALKIVKDMRRSMVVKIPVTNGLSKVKNHKSYIIRFTCQIIGEIVFGLSGIRRPQTPLGIISRYPWTGLSKVQNHSFGSLTGFYIWSKIGAKELKFFDRVKKFMEKNEHTKPTNKKT